MHKSALMTYQNCFCNEEFKCWWFPDWVHSLLRWLIELQDRPHIVSIASIQRYQCRDRIKNRHKIIPMFLLSCPRDLMNSIQDCRVQNRKHWINFLIWPEDFFIPHLGTVVGPYAGYVRIPASCAWSTSSTFQVKLSTAIASNLLRRARGLFVMRGQ